MLTGLIRTVILFLVTALVVRLMGKRQLAQLQPYEFVVTLMISDLATQPMSDVEMPLLSGVVVLCLGGGSWLGAAKPPQAVSNRWSMAAVSARVAEPRGRNAPLASPCTTPLRCMAATLSAAQELMLPLSVKVTALWLWERLTPMTEAKRLSMVHSCSRVMLLLGEKVLSEHTPLTTPFSKAQTA